MDNSSYLEAYLEMVDLRNLADHTRRSYKTYISAYLAYLEKQGLSPEDAGWKEIRAYLLYIKKERNLSDRTINAATSQIRFFTEYVLRREWDERQVPMRKYDVYLPFVPSRDMVCEFINSIESLKDRTIITLMYSCGLRVSEVCALKYEDVSRKEHLLHIRHSKNRTDRYVPLSDTALNMLTRYWFEYGRPENVLFPRPSDPDHPIYNQYVQILIARQEEKTGWPHRLTPHSFRHAFATHVYEQTKDLLLVQKILGHKSIASTSIYVHLAEVKQFPFANPLDEMEVSV